MAILDIDRCPRCKWAKAAINALCIVCSSEDELRKRGLLPANKAGIVQHEQFKAPQGRDIFERRNN